MIKKIFFNKYIDNKECILEKNKKPPYSGYYYHFICYIEDTKKRDNFLKSFPPLIFYQKEINYNFTMDYNDLFTIIPDGKRILFNVEFNNGSQKWELGKPFFKKYQFIFDIDTKLIKFYIDSNNSEVSNNKNYNKNIIIFILIIIVFFIGILFGRLLCNKYNRKIRANELEDNYSYNPKNNYEKNGMINIDSKNDNLINNENKIRNKLNI